MICLKTRNAIIISPHPAAKECTIAAAKVVLEAAVKAGAPEGIIGWIDAPSLELTNTVMRDADIILATGGPGMVKAAYSSGKPALGVGAGNTPVIIDDTADVRMAVNSIIHSKTFDNGMICASEQSVTVLESVYEQAKKEFAYRGCYFLKPGKELDAVRKTIIINGALNSKIPGKSAYEIAKLAGVSRGTVDRVIHQRGRVAPEVEKRIRDIMDENDYHPNMLGRALAVSKTPLTIGMIMIEKGNPFFQLIHSGMKEAISQFRDYPISVDFRHINGVDEEEYLNVLDELESIYFAF